MKNIYSKTLAGLSKLGGRNRTQVKGGMDVKKTPVDTCSNVYVYSKELNQKQKVKELGYQCTIVDIQKDLKKLEDQINALIAAKTKGN